MSADEFESHQRCVEVDRPVHVTCAYALVRMLVWTNMMFLTHFISAGKYIEATATWHGLTSRK
jgi:hypothetical protein